MIMSVKNKEFEYIVFLINEWRKTCNISERVLTKLRLQKLLFLLSTVEITVDVNSKGLLQYFNHFYALPYGPVEIDIYHSMNHNGDFNNISFNGNFCVIDDLENVNESEIEMNFKKQAKRSIELLKSKKRNYLSMPVFDLVAITHQWSVWINSFSAAQMLGGKQFPMKLDAICNSEVKAC